MSEFKQVQRQVQMMVFLSEATSGLTTRQLQQRLERNGFQMDIRTLRRDLDDLTRIFGIEVRGSEREPIYRLGGIRLDGIFQQFDDMQTFRMLCELAKPFEASESGQRMQLFLKRIRQSLSEEQREWLHKAESILTVNPGSLQDESHILLEVRKAIEEGIYSKQVIHIRNFSFSSNTQNERDVEPMRMEFFKGCHYLWAFCRMKQDMRCFRLSRIEAVQLLTEQFEPRIELLDMAMKRRFESMSSSDAVRVIIRFHGFAARMVQEYHSNDHTLLTKQEDGTLLYERELGITDEFFRFVMGFGAEAEVLEPAELRARVADAAFGMMARYYRK